MWRQASGSSSGRRIPAQPPAREAPRAFLRVLGRWNSCRRREDQSARRRIPGPYSSEIPVHVRGVEPFGAEDVPDEGKNGFSERGRDVRVPERTRDDQSPKGKERRDDLEHLAVSRFIEIVVPEDPEHFFEHALEPAWALEGKEEVVCAHRGGIVGR